MGAGERGRRGSVGRGRRGEGETAVRRKVLGEQMGEGGVGVGEAGCWLAGGKYHPKGLEAAVVFEVSIDPKGLQTPRVSKVSSCVHIQIETKGHAGHVVGFAVKVTGRDESQGAMTRLAMPLRRCHA